MIRMSIQPDPEHAIPTPNTTTPHAAYIPSSSTRMPSGGETTARGGGSGKHAMLAAMSSRQNAHASDGKAHLTRAAAPTPFTQAWSPAPPPPKMYGQRTPAKQMNGGSKGNKSARGGPNSARGGGFFGWGMPASPPSQDYGAMLGKGFTPRTADKLRLPLKSMGPQMLIDERVPKNAESGRPALSATGHVLDAKVYTPGGQTSVGRAAHAEDLRPDDNSPLSSSARKRLSSGARWLGELKLRNTMMGPASARRSPRRPDLDDYKSKPITEGTPRLKPKELKEFFSQKEQEHEEDPESSRPQDDVWVLIKRGEVDSRRSLSFKRGSSVQA